MINAFDTEVAQIVGVNAAIIYKNISYWCEKNRANNQNEHDGLFWTFNSIKAFKKLFPYLSEKEIRNALNKLIDKGFIKTGIFNDDARDRTKWYADLSPKINNIEAPIEEDSIYTKGQMSMPEREDTFAPTGEALPDDYHITTQITTNNKKKERKKEPAEEDRTTYDEILDSVPVIKENPELRAAFVEFIKSRAMLKSQLTDTALKLNINKAFEIARGDPKKMIEVVNQSIERGYRGIFDVKSEASKPRSYGRRTGKEAGITVEPIEPISYESPRIIENPGSQPLDCIHDGIRGSDSDFDPILDFIKANN